MASEYVYSIFSVWFEDIPSHSDVQIALTNLQLLTIVLQHDSWMKIGNGAPTNAGVELINHQCVTIQRSADSELVTLSYFEQLPQQ